MKRGAGGKDALRVWNSTVSPGGLAPPCPWLIGKRGDKEQFTGFSSALRRGGRAATVASRNFIPQFSSGGVPNQQAVQKVWTVLP